MEKEKRLLVIDNSVGDYYKPMNRLPGEDFSMEMDVVNYYRGESVQNLEPYTHIIATGCTKSICEIEPWMLKVADLFRSALELDLNLLTICFSHQLLARMAAGEAWVRRRREPEFGWVEQEVLEDDPIFGKRGDRIWGFVSHFDEVAAEIPKDKAVVVLRSHTCGVEAFRVRGKRAWGVQGHFEESPESGADMLRSICQEDSRLEKWIQNGGNPRDDGYWKVILKRFQAL